MKKTIIALVVLTILILLFIEKCSLVNLSTANVFIPSAYKNAKGLKDTARSKKYEIVPLAGDFPILFDGFKNEFYVSNKKGLTKIDAQGNVMFADDLLAEKYTSVFTFENFTPYVFVEKGVYDFSGEKLIFYPFSKVQNAKNEISNADFKAIFEHYYQNAELVIYGSDENIDLESDCYPMYFKINNEWILLFSQKGDYRFNNTIIGQRDFEKFPAKFANKRLIVLKENRNGTYSTKQVSEKVDDEYLKTNYTQVLKEQKLAYQSNNDVKIVAHKKHGYHFTGSYLSLPNWVCPTFLNTAYLQLTYHNDKLYFKEQALQKSTDFNCENEMYLYELPKKFRKNNKVAFLAYELNLGGFSDSLDNIIQVNKNAGLYIIRAKNLNN